jgi:hypothetical protein
VVRRYSWNDESQFATNPLTVDGNVLKTRASQWVLSNIRTLAPNKVNDARFGYNSLFNNITQQLAGVEDVNAKLGTPVKVTDPNSWGIPNIGLSQNLTSFGNPTSSPFQIDDKFFQFVDNFSWVRGKHSLRMGGEYGSTIFRRSETNSRASSFQQPVHQHHNADQRHCRHAVRRVHRRRLHVGL